MRSVSACAVSPMTSSLRWSVGGALPQLVFVLEAGIKALEVRPVPEHVRLFLDRDAPRYPLPDQKRVADMFQDLAPVAGRRPFSARSRAKGSMLENAAASFSSRARTTLFESASAITTSRAGDRFLTKIGPPGGI